MQGPSIAPGFALSADPPLSPRQTRLACGDAEASGNGSGAPSSSTCCEPGQFRDDLMLTYVVTILCASPHRVCPDVVDTSIHACEKRRSYSTIANTASLLHHIKPALELMLLGTCHQALIRGHTKGSTPEAPHTQPSAVHASDFEREKSSVSSLNGNICLSSIHRPRMTAREKLASTKLPSGCRVSTETNKRVQRRHEHCLRTWSRACLRSPGMFSSDPRHYFFCAARTQHGDTGGTGSTG